MNETTWARHAVMAVLLAAGLCVISCRSHMDAAFDECIAGKRFGCAVEVASLEAERRPSCCVCIARLALAKKEDALARMQTLSPSELADALRRAALSYEEAAVCGKGGSVYANAAIEAMKFYREVVLDEDSSQWIAITAIEDRDRRIEAVIAHDTFHGNRCLHDVRGEYDAYRSAMASAPTFEIRRRLPLMANTPIAAELFQVYYVRRREELPRTAASELEVLEQIRIELYSTPYRTMAEQALSVRAAASDDPFEVERICRSLGPGVGRDACYGRAQDLWRKAIGGAPVRQLVEICPRLQSPGLRARCQAVLAEEALKLVAEDANAEDLALAEAAARNAGAEYRRDWRIRLLRRDAERNFSRVVNPEPELQAELTESIGAWTEFIEVFDTLTRKVSDNRHESLRSIHPDLVRRIDRRKGILKGNADKLYRSIAADCREEETKLSQKLGGVKLDFVRRCISDLAKVLTIDETHANAPKLLGDLEAATTDLKLSQRTAWTTVVVPVLLTEALRGFLPPSLARLLFRTLQSLHF